MAWLRHVSIHGDPLFDDAGRFAGYRGIGRDITAQIEAEQELERAKERAEQAETLLRDAVDSISEGFVIFDRDDRFVMCNDGYRQIYAEGAETPGAGRARSRTSCAWPMPTAAATPTGAAAKRNGSPNGCGTTTRPRASIEYPPWPTAAGIWSPTGG